jgi:hypothetical protein
MTIELIVNIHAFLGRRSQRKRARGARDSTRGTDERRARSILQRAASGAGGAGLRPAGAGVGEERV